MTGQDLLEFPTEDSLNFTNREQVGELRHTMRLNDFKFYDIKALENSRQIGRLVNLEPYQLYDPETDKILPKPRDVIVETQADEGEDDNENDHNSQSFNNDTSESFQLPDFENNYKTSLFDDSQLKSTQNELHSRLESVYKNPSKVLLPPFPMDEDFQKMIENSRQDRYEKDSSDEILQELDEQRHASPLKKKKSSKTRSAKMVGPFLVSESESEELENSPNSHDERHITPDSSKKPQEYYDMNEEHRSVSKKTKRRNNTDSDSGSSGIFVGQSDHTNSDLESTQQTGDNIAISNLPNDESISIRNSRQSFLSTTKERPSNSSDKISNSAHNDQREVIGFEDSSDGFDSPEHHKKKKVPYLSATKSNAKSDKTSNPSTQDEIGNDSKNKNKEKETSETQSGLPIRDFRLGRVPIPEVSTAASLVPDKRLPFTLYEDVAIISALSDPRVKNRSGSLLFAVKVLSETIFKDKRSYESLLTRWKKRLSKVTNSYIELSKKTKHKPIDLTKFFDEFEKQMAERREIPAPPTVDERRVKSRTRNFTLEEDLELLEYLLSKTNLKPTGKVLYNKYAETHNWRSGESWRARYIKYFRPIIEAYKQDPNSSVCANYKSVLDKHVDFIQTLNTAGVSLPSNMTFSKQQFGSATYNQKRFQIQKRTTEVDDDMFRDENPFKKQQETTGNDKGPLSEIEDSDAYDDEDDFDVLDFGGHKSNTTDLLDHDSSNMEENGHNRSLEVGSKQNSDDENNKSKSGKISSTLKFPLSNSIHPISPAFLK